MESTTSTRCTASSSGSYDPTPVVARAHALEETAPLEAVDVTRHRGRRDALLGGELGERQPGTALHEPEERRLTGCDPELLGLLAQLAGKAQDRRPQLGGDCLRGKRNLANH